MAEREQRRWIVALLAPFVAASAFLCATFATAGGAAWTNWFFAPALLLVPAWIGTLVYLALTSDTNEAGERLGALPAPKCGALARAEGGVERAGTGSWNSARARRDDLLEPTIDELPCAGRQGGFGMTRRRHLAGWTRPAGGWLVFPADRRLAKRWPYANLVSWRASLWARSLEISGAVRPLSAQASGGG